MLTKFRTTLIVVVAMWLVLSAFQVELPGEVDSAIVAIIGFLVMILGPKPLGRLFTLLRIPAGAWRVVATYAASVVVGVIAVGLAGLLFTGLTWPPSIEQVLALGGLLALSAQASYHRLKDNGSLG